MYTMMGYAGSIAFVPIGKNALATLRNVPAAIAETRPHVMLSVPALARNFKKNIETGIKKKGPKVEKLFNFALNNAIKYNKEYYNRGTGGTFWRKPLVALFDKILFKQVRESFGGRMQFFVAAAPCWTSNSSASSAPWACPCSRATASPKPPRSSARTPQAMPASAPPAGW